MSDDNVNEFLHNTLPTIAEELLRVLGGETEAGWMKIDAGKPVVGPEGPTYSREPVHVVFLNDKHAAAVKEALQKSAGRGADRTDHSS